MCRTCVLTVFAERNSSPAISGVDRLLGRNPRTRNSPGLSGSSSDAAGVLDGACPPARMSVSSSRSCALGRAVTRMAREQLGAAGHDEGQDEPVALGQLERLLDGRFRRGAVAQLDERLRGDHLRVARGELVQRGSCPGPHRLEHVDRVLEPAVGEVHRRDRGQRLAPACGFLVELLQRAAGVFEETEPDLRGDPEQADLDGQRVLGDEQTLHLLGGAELGEGLGPVAEAGAEHAARQVHEQRGRGLDLGPHGGLGRAEELVGAIPLAGERVLATVCRERDRDDVVGRPAVAVGELDRLAAAPAAVGERAADRGEPEVGATGDLEIRPFDPAGDVRGFQQVLVSRLPAAATTSRRRRGSSARPRAALRRARRRHASETSPARPGRPPGPRRPRSHRAGARA